MSKRLMWATVNESGQIRDVHTEQPGRISPAYRGILRTVRVEVRIIKPRRKGKEKRNG